MTQLSDILDIGELDAEVQAGYVTVRPHPEFFNLKIANYTDRCAFDRHWTPVTRVTRGLIYDDNTFEVLARPFEKFFNFDEKEAPRILDDQVVWHWADKADGSLGIMYRDPLGYYRMATRGSFASEQAGLALELMSSWSAGEWEDYTGMLKNGYTPLFEITGPSNRIVLRYPEDALVPLGYIHILSGEFVPPAGAERRTMRDLLGDLSRSNAEGWVVWLSNRQPLKIKQADYIELHRMVSNLTPKEVWRQARAGTYHEYVKHLPDELYDLASKWHGELTNRFAELLIKASLAHSFVRARKYETRKEQAAWIQKNVPAEQRGLVFGMLDGKNVSDSIYRMIEPRGVE